jgi:hypothetical protein
MMREKFNKGQLSNIREGFTYRYIATHSINQGQLSNIREGFTYRYSATHSINQGQLSNIREGFTYRYSATHSIKSHEMGFIVCKFVTVFDAFMSLNPFTEQNNANSFRLCKITFSKGTWLASRFL